MTSLLSKRRKSFDWISFMIYLALVSIGWLMVYSSSAGDGAPWFTNLDQLHSKQLLWIIVSLCGLFATLLIPFVFWRNFSFVIYFISILILIAVLIFGTEIKGAQSWFSLGAFTFQPAEFAKLAAALAVAAFTSSNSFKIGNRRSLLTGIGLFMLPAGLILIQPDAGSTLVFFSFFLLFYRLGLWHGYFILFFSAMALFILSIVYSPILVAALLMILGSSILFYNLELSSAVYLLLLVASLISTVVIADFYDKPLWSLLINGVVFTSLALFQIYRSKFRLAGLMIPMVLGGILFSYSTDFLINNFLESHQQERINVWLQPAKCDPRGSLYNVIQSKVAIGSGGLTGKGFTQGSMTKLNYVPEQSTDFIFCTVGEEQGFLGVLGVLLLYAVFIGRIFLKSEQSRKPFIRNYGYALGGILFFHFFINVGMTMGLVPIIGIPLPFLSYGGSSLIFFSLMIGIFLRLQQDDR